ncbi:type III secretion system stator protein SctL [Rhizobium paknamense]|uniref:Type III secretion system HrpE/YscL family protein n=1 Tax=Rhizobium paknamense TaxID=1206817 RepID=A0ABU0IDT3_9HYPH|nr:type III secretion system stator protein SctL [Rhizobium paknamense]MDQ0456385.1 type III secretion system HrpE/YscL family protein [Rhizobium paknamense]
MAAQIIPGEEMGIFIDAKSLLVKAEHVLAVAESECEAKAEAARNAGYRDGYERGLAEALGAVEPLVQQASQALRSLEQDIEAVVIQALGLVLGSIPPETRIRLLINRALAEVNAARQVVLRVAVSDEPSVRRAIAGLGDHIRVDVDRLLQSGEMTLETGTGHRHIGLMAQLSRVMEGLSHA